MDENKMPISLSFPIISFLIHFLFLECFFSRQWVLKELLRCIKKTDNKLDLPE